MSPAGCKSAVFERQLKKIYDCLNIGSNKKAVQEVDRLPKNEKDLPVFKSLKALALIRLGKRRQAFEILEEIDPQQDLDEVTLQSMTSCYKESVDIGKIVDLYEAAVAREPDDPEIMAHLFMAYVRVFNFKRQKEIAMQMYKNFSKKKRLYSFWAIMSLVMQSQEYQIDDREMSPDKKVCLSLAEKMCEKMIDDERSHEEIELYLMILRKQQKHEEEYRFLTGPSCLRITDHLSWFNRRRAYLCFDLKMYSRAFKHYFPSLIQEFPDQIEYYQGLFKSALLLDTEGISQQQPVAISEQQSTGTTQSASTPVKTSSALAECIDIVERQCQSTLETNDPTKENSKTKNQSSKSLSRTSSLNPGRRRMLRGPLIARVELYHTILSNESILSKNVYTQCLNQFNNKYPKLSSLLLDFFQSFSKKIICHYDMDYMLNRYKLSPDECSELLKTIDLWIEDLKTQTGEINAYDMFHIILNYNMLEHSLRNYAPSDDREVRLRLAKNYVRLYNENIELGKRCKTEFLPVDHYCLLAINSIMTNSAESPDRLTKSFLDDQIMIGLLVMVETATMNSPGNHQIRLLLLKLYSLIGASKQSSNVLATLDIKHFQIDTLGHLLNPVLYNTGNYSQSKESLEACLDFYAHGVRECFEGLTTSYRDGKYSKIEEVSRIFKRLSDSLNAAQCVLLRGVVSNLSASSIEELIVASQTFDLFKGLHRMFRCPTSKDKIEDNRDFKVLKSLHFGVNDLIRTRQKQTLEDEKLWIKLRYYMLRSVYLQIDLVFVESRARPKDANKSELVAELEYSLKEIDTMLIRIKEHLEEHHQLGHSFIEPETTPFRWKHAKFETLVNLVRTTMSFSDSQGGMTQDKFDHYCRTFEEIVSDIENQFSSITSFFDMKNTLTVLTLSLEFISMCVTVLVSLSSLEMNGYGNHSVVTTKSAPSQQVAQPVNPKAKSLLQQMINRTEIQLTRIASKIKGFDLRSFVVDKASKLEPSLMCDLEYDCIVDAKSLTPLLTATHSELLLSKVRELIFDSYNDSLKEIELTVRRKTKLLRAKT